MTATPLKHLVFVGGLSWTRVRAGIKFSVRPIEKFPNADISVYTFGPLAAQANAYLATHPKVTHERTRIVASVVDSPVTNPLDLVFSLENSFKLWIGQQLEIASFEAGGHVVAPPRSYKWRSGPRAWAPGCFVDFDRHFGNPDHGHRGRLLGSIGAALAKQEPGAEKPIEKIFHEVLSDRMVCIPGLPPLYEHEQILQVLPAVLPLVTQLQARWNIMRDHMKVALLSGTYEMEPIAAQACATAFTKPVRPFCIGPSIDFPLAPPADPDSTIEFLDKVYAELGPHSVIYISFGT
ncbi:hypothetical protein FRC08_016603 [Ceratobasidium sp. 394]|nr:hypothetical protein FRC08_016603 [Ceratobasidium sp. 394]